MRIGLVFECGPRGADRKVCEQLAKRLKPDLEVISETLDNKPNLIAECGTVTADLLDDGCEKVIIVWDLHPAWRERGGKPCRKEDCDAIHSSLDAAGVDAQKVALVCIEEELESWLIADERALEKVLSKPHRRVRIRRRRNTKQLRNPKAILRDFFRQNRRGDYIDYYHAELIAKAIPDFQRLRRVDSFRRFAEKVADVQL